MSFLSQLQQLKLLRAVRYFLFSSGKKAHKTSDEIVELWTTYRSTEPFEHLETGVFPKASENGFDGQQKGIYFWNQKGGPQVWLLDGRDLGRAYKTLMASTILKKNQLSWPDWKIDAFIHKDDLIDLVEKHASRLWKKQEHDLVYPVGREYTSSSLFKDDIYDESIPHLVHSILVAKDGIHVRDESADWSIDDQQYRFRHKNIEDHVITHGVRARTGALEIAIDCLCQTDSKFRADYNEILQKLPFETGLKALKYCSEESLPVATVRSMIGLIFSKVEYVNPLIKGYVRDDHVGDSFEGYISTRLPEAFEKGTGYWEAYQVNSFRTFYKELKRELINGVKGFTR